ncbi:MAG: hypothetical protein CVV27_17890 [Candidatus Melainabacteria bacterium HGW-Melainabacteria-1]|nr:MAG: hypothetical protein CVV27_17890 [Candidatus Melainabacteria bacterium HGW-Melainabacteria-1]
MSEFVRVFSGSPYETRFGFCRGIRFADQIQIAGTAPIDPDGSVHAPGDAFAQACRCLEIAALALAELGGNLAQVYRVRWYLTDISQQHDVGRAHAQYFTGHPPVATMLEVSALVDPQMLVEVELEAWTGA